MSEIKILDCTLRDGGYYNSWDFPIGVVNDYLNSMVEAKVDIVELGLRTRGKDCLYGEAAFTKDSYLDQLTLPDQLKYGVMVNASDFVKADSPDAVIRELFPRAKGDTNVSLVRIACHVHEFKKALEVSGLLKDMGFDVGYNLMQVADRSEGEIKEIFGCGKNFPVDVLYFADSLGSMNPQHTKQIIQWIKSTWSGEIGIHTHDNMGLALQNTLSAADEGVTWLDATVTGMGRGPGNARTEEVVIEISQRLGKDINLMPLLRLINSYFAPMKKGKGWGSNPYYYLAGKYGIHPTYIQEMLSDSRYNEEEIFNAIGVLKNQGGKKFSFDQLNGARSIPLAGELEGISANDFVQGRDVLIVASGDSAKKHQVALESFVKQKKPLVVALNVCDSLDGSIVDYRIASHPMRILGDWVIHKRLPQKLIAPKTLIPSDAKEADIENKVINFPYQVKESTFAFSCDSVVLPNSMVVSYALGFAIAGGAKRIYLAGFDGFGGNDARTKEVQEVFSTIASFSDTTLVSLTETEYSIAVKSVYGL